MTREERDALRKLCDAATPGPWEVVGSSVCDWKDYSYSMEWLANRNHNVPNDGHFIAAARNALPQLLDALDAADAEIAALKRDAERWREVERRARYWYHTYWVINAGCVGTFAESIDAAIAERKRKDQP